MRRFRDDRKQQAYEHALNNHDDYVKGMSGQKNAYKLGFFFPWKPFPKTWVCYPYWRAGADNAKRRNRT